MNLKTLYLELITNKPVKENASKLRGYLGNKFSEFAILHHHIYNIGYIYSYPRVQYKVIEGTPYILGIEEGVQILKAISGEFNELLLGKNEYIIHQKKHYEQDSEFGVSDTYLHYRFLTPWLALNQKNVKKFREITNWREKKKFLNSIIIGNVISMCKGLGMFEENELLVHTKIDECRVNYNGMEFIGFTGEFEINFNIPDFFGLGQGVSEGYGAVRSC